jgi:hypothetical protein
MKLVKCLEIKYLLSLPRNFKEYKQRTFNEAHACHFLVLQRCYDTIASFIKLEVWHELGDNVRNMDATLCTVGSRRR